MLSSCPAGDEYSSATTRRAAPAPIRRPDRRAAPPGRRAGRGRRSPRRAASSSRRRSARHNTTSDRKCAPAAIRAIPTSMPNPSAVAIASRRRRAGREQQGKAHDGKRQRGMTRDKGAVALALRRRQRRRSELARAAERHRSGTAAPDPNCLSGRCWRSAPDRARWRRRGTRAPCGRDATADGRSAPARPRRPRQSATISSVIHGPCPRPRPAAPSGPSGNPSPGT